MCEQYRMNSTAGRKPGNLIPNLYFYDVKYRPILSKIDKKKNVLKQNSNNSKKIKNKKWAGPDPF